MFFVLDICNYEELQSMLDIPVYLGSEITETGSMVLISATGRLSVIALIYTLYLTASYCYTTILTTHLSPTKTSTHFLSCGKFLSSLDV